MRARILLLVLLAFAAPALAEDVPLPPLTPKGEYLVMTQDDATSSSQCIGDPATPMCAVETMLACFNRVVDDLCRIAMGLEMKPGYVEGVELRNILYRIFRSEILADQTIPWRRQKGDRPDGLMMQAGDMRIDFLEVNCRKDDSSPSECEKRNNIITTSCQKDNLSPSACGQERGWDADQSAYIVRQRGDRWIVVDWSPMYDPFW